MTRITLTQIKDKASDLAASGLVKSTQMAEIAKLQLNNVSQEDVIKRAFFEMGKRYYEQHGENPDPAYMAACQKVDACYQVIEKNKQRMEELKHPDVLSIYDVSVNAMDAEVVEADVIESEDDMELEKEEL